MEKVTKDLLFSYLEEIHPDAKCALNYRNDYELLVSIILSAQTTDVKVNKVTKILFEKYNNIHSLSTANVKDVENIIKELGLYQVKAKNIISAMKNLYENGYSYIPNDPEFLISLPGVGRKTLNVFLAEYYHCQTLGVDTHILRVSKRLGLTGYESNAFECEKDLIKFIGNYEYRRAHHLLIAFGRQECHAKNPECHICKIRDHCIYDSKLLK